MEDDENPSGGNLIPIALAGLAIVLGGAGLYFGMTANQRLTPLNETLEAGTSSVARFEKDIAAVETRVNELAAQLSEATATVGRLRTYGSQTEQAVKQIASEVKANREQIVKTAEQLNAFAAKGFRLAEEPETTPPSETGGGRPQNEAGENGSDGVGATATYTIQSGDTFARIADARGIPLQALLDANPDVEPHRLRIGQKINLPSN